MTTAVAKKKAADIAIVDDSDLLEHAGEGFEGADKDSFAIPFLAILQKMSPQVDEGDGAYIEGAKAGMIFNTVTQELYDGKTGVEVIPCKPHRSFIEWVPRDGGGGGGFVGQYSVDEGLELLTRTVKNEKGQDMLENGNYIADTREHYVLIVNEDGTTQPALISMTSTQIKKSKQWMYRMNNVRIMVKDQRIVPPSFALRWRMTTVPESNDKGSWSGWKIALAGETAEESRVSPAQFQDAKLFRDALADNKVEVNREQAGAADDLPEQDL